MHESLSFGCSPPDVAAERPGAGTGLVGYAWRLRARRTLRSASAAFSRPIPIPHLALTGPRHRAGGPRQEHPHHVLRFTRACARAHPRRRGPGLHRAHPRPGPGDPARPRRSRRACRRPDGHRQDGRLRPADPPAADGRPTRAGGSAGPDGPARERVPRQAPQPRPRRSAQRDPRSRSASSSSPRPASSRSRSRRASAPTAPGTRSARPPSTAASATTRRSARCAPARRSSWPRPAACSTTSSSARST